MYNEINWLQLCVILIVTLSGIWFYNTLIPEVEGFQQKEPFVLKENNAVYDPFYIEEYDSLYETEMYSDSDLEQILYHTHPSVHTSTFLDIGCGTGSLLSKLSKKQFSVFGIDKSSNMLDIAKTNVPDGEFYKHDAVKDPMLFENKSFSHILCTHFTLYEIEDKEKLFRHCFHWLKSGGFFIVHLIVPDKFNMVVPHSELYSHVGAHDAKIKNTNMMYKDYSYRNEYITADTTWKQKEEFSCNGIVRQNERTLYMLSKHDIISIGLKTGFLVHAEVSYDKFDEHQSLVIFAKPQCGDC